MKSVIAAILAMGLVTPTLAQDFVPYTVGKEDQEKLLLFLNNVPYQYASQLVQWLQTKEGLALAEKAKAEDEAKKKDDPKK